MNFYNPLANDNMCSQLLQPFSQLKQLYLALTTL